MLSMDAYDRFCHALDVVDLQRTDGRGRTFLCRCARPAAAPARRPGRCRGRSGSHPIAVDEELHVGDVAAGGRAMIQSAVVSVLPVATWLVSARSVVVLHCDHAVAVRAEPDRFANRIHRGIMVAATDRRRSERRLPFVRQLLITGPLDAALYWADALHERLSATVLAIGRMVGATLPAERAFPVYTGGSPRSPDGWGVRGFVVAGKSDRPRPVHALQRVPSRLSRARDRRELPGRPRPLQGPSRVRRRRAAPWRRSISRARTWRARRPSISCSTFGTAVVRSSPAAARLLSAGRGRRRAGQGGVPTSPGSSANREAEVLRFQGVAMRAQPIAHRGLHQCIDVCSALAIPARRRPHCRGAAFVRRMRRMHHGVPVGRAYLRLSLGARPHPAHQDAACNVRARGRARRMPSLPRRGGPRRHRSSRAARQGTPAA